MSKRTADRAMLAAQKPKAVTRDGYTANQMKNLAISLIEKRGGRAWIANVGAAICVLLAFYAMVWLGAYGKETK